MDQAEALRELRKEILEVLEFHYEQLRRASGPPSGKYGDYVGNYKFMKLYNKYAILIYSDALKEVELYLELASKQ